MVPKSYFWPVAIATTFVDYYGYGFVRGPDGDAEVINGRAMRPAAVFLARASTTAGVVVAVSTAVAGSGR